MLLDHIQNQLTDLYHIDLSQRAQDYLIDRREALNLLESPSHSKIPKELLLVRQQNDETVEIALFLDQGLLKNLEQFDPQVSLSEENLSDFCIAVEGISHFVYFLWKANQGHKITQLEMELQAEIDKFLILYFAMGSSRTISSNVDKLFSALFEDFHLFDNMSGESEERYMTASHLAMRYCHRLHERFLRKSETDKALNEARQFYNLSQSEKIHLINQ